MQWTGSEPISTFAYFVTIDAMLNCDGDVNAGVKCEQSIKESLFPRNVCVNVNVYIEV